MALMIKEGDGFVTIGEHKVSTNDIIKISEYHMSPPYGERAGESWVRTEVTWIPDWDGKTYEGTYAFHSDEVDFLDEINAILRSARKPEHKLRMRVGM